MKKWYFSKTVKVAFLQLLIALIMAFTSANPTVDYMSYILMVKSGLDFMLRMATKEELV